MIVRNCFLVLFLLCLALVLYGIFRPEPPPELFSQSDKVGHVLAFLALGVTGRASFPVLSPWFFWPPLLVAAPALEWLQHATRPLRIFSVEDAASNLAGAVLAMGVAAAWGLIGGRYLQQRRSGLAAALRGPPP